MTPFEWPHLYRDVPVVVHTAEEARQAVRKAKAAGVDSSSSITD